MRFVRLYYAKGGDGSLKGLYLLAAAILVSHYIVLFQWPFSHVFPSRNGWSAVGILLLTGAEWSGTWHQVLYSRVGRGHCVSDRPCFKTLVFVGLNCENFFPHCYVQYDIQASGIAIFGIKTSLCGFLATALWNSWCLVSNHRHIFFRCGHGPIQMDVVWQEWRYWGLTSNSNIMKKSCIKLSDKPTQSIDLWSKKIFVSLAIRSIPI